jgi:glycosyltransferase involved in cell wall biosynthesis
MNNESPSRPSPDRQRILMVGSALALGGSERQLLATVQGLRAAGYELEIFELNEAPLEFGVEAEFWKLGIPSWRTSDFPTERVAAADEPAANGLAPFASLVDGIDIVGAGIALKRLIERFRPHVVHCWSDTANIVGGLVAADLDVPRIVLSQRSVPPSLTGHRQTELYRDGYRRLRDRSNVVMVSNSETNGSSYEHWLDLPPGTIAVIRNGLWPRSFRVCPPDEAAKCRARLGLPEDAPVVGAVMRFAVEKDPLLWIATAAAIAAQRPDVWFVLAGYGELDDQVRSQIAERKLGERVILPGPAADSGMIYAAMDVFLLTSLFEGLPNVLIEAQAAGRPVVAPHVGGVAEAFCHRETGLLVEQRNAASLAAAVLEILADPGWRLAASASGPAFVADRFGAERMIDETVALYRLPAAEKSQGRLDAADEPFRHAASNRIAQLQTALAAEHDAFAARTRELEANLERERRAHADQIAEAQRTQAAERDAAVKRIRGLEATLEAEHRAFVARIRELEGELQALREALAKVSSSRWFRLGRSLVAIRNRIILRRSV